MSSEDRTSLGETQALADEVIRSWPDVRTKQVFGYRGYLRGTKMFAFLTEDGLAVSAKSPDDLHELYSRTEVRPFTYRGMPMRQWAVIPAQNDAEMREALTSAERAYEGLA